MNAKNNSVRRRLIKVAAWLKRREQIGELKRQQRFPRPAKIHRADRHIVAQRVLLKGGGTDLRVIERTTRGRFGSQIS